MVLKYSTDTSKLTVESPLEIIVGKTTRPESLTALEKIKGVAYRIERNENKIVIAASNDTMLEAALNRFKELLTVEEGKLTVTVGRIRESSEQEVFPLEVDGQIPFRIILPKRYSDDLYDAAKNIATLLSGFTDQTFKVELDSKVEATDDAYEICLGNTNRKISEDLYNEIDSIFEYRIKIDGHRIAVGGKLDAQLVKGVEQLRDELAQAFDGTYAGVPSLPRDYSVVYASSKVAKDVVLPDGGTLQGLLDCGQDSYILYYKNVKEKTTYDDYVAKLKANGASVSATYTLGENSYTLLKHATYSAYVTYLVADKAMRVYIGSPSDLDPSSAAVADAELVTPKLFSMQIDVFAGGADGGMSYAIQLTDGKFLVFDGGYSNSDATRLLKVMNENKPASHAKPIVAGWFISHLHGDHYWGLTAMSSNHAIRACQPCDQCLLRHLI